MSEYSSDRWHSVPPSPHPLRQVNTRSKVLGAGKDDARKPFIDCRQIPDGQAFDCDICLIGGGAAGITIAREFADQGREVVILESGGLAHDPAAQDLGRLVVTGHAYLETESRSRLFGGTTNDWGGHCVPLRRYVFEERDWIPDGAWPFGLDELVPYYVRAHEVLEIGPYDYDPEPVARRLDLPILPFDPARVETVLSRYHRQSFGKRYRDEIGRSADLRVLLFATVASLQVSDDTRRVTQVTVKSPAGNAISLRPRIAVLSAGGIENARLLLLSNDRAPAGIGNRYDLVGRYFSDHIALANGVILPSDQDPERAKLYRSELPFEDGYGVRCHLSLSESLNAALRIPDYRSELHIGHGYKHHPTIISARRIRQSYRNLTLDCLDGRDLINVIADPVTPLRHLSDRQGGPLVYALANYVEQVPNPESRVRLSEEKDALGMNRPEVNWRLSSLDKDGIVKAQAVIAAEVARAGIGRMRCYIPDSEETILKGSGGGSHHMGTTRMHADPKRGVVDADGRVHGVENLFITGSSVFPSYGYSNPTLTVVALAIRLADHLKALFAKGL